MAVFPSDEWMARLPGPDQRLGRVPGGGRDLGGRVAFVFEAEPDNGVPEDLVALLDLWHGECRERADARPPVRRTRRT